MSVFGGSCEESGATMLCDIELPVKVNGFYFTNSIGASHFNPRE